MSVDGNVRRLLPARYPAIAGIWGNRAAHQNWERCSDYRGVLAAKNKAVQNIPRTVDRDRFAGGTYALPSRLFHCKVERVRSQYSTRKDNLDYRGVGPSVSRIGLIVDDHYG